MSSPVWQFQMGDPEALNSANTQFQFLPFHHGMSLQNVIFTCAAIIIQILMARISWAGLKTFNKNNSCHSIQTMWNVQKEHNRQKDNLKCCLIFSISCIHMKENEDLIFWTITIPKKLKYFIREDHFELQRCLNNHNICHVQCKTDVIIHI